MRPKLSVKGFGSAEVNAVRGRIDSSAVIPDTIR